MGDELKVFQYTFTEGKSTKQPVKRLPNMFISYRNDMMTKKPHNMPMTEYSRLVSKWWKELSESKKSELQMRYHIDRDRKLYLPSIKDEKPLKKCFNNNEDVLNK
ncbi:19546_t:CDS:1 [Funneliformis geosporum]|uniref:1697_t:CDS:1 n=1 Tax=Funneliformis geosporum TaxID=1117311 RepID=A0A9W4WWX5_9GLOM|nr:19546_t:CDS:1 [Funneliformis geosporum]CAI2178319.1 1697_t:CDS:1 [Funneliformis geosporum]